MRIQTTTIITSITCLFWALTQVSCKKLIHIPPPTNTLTTSQVFNSVSQAEAAMAGVYSRMINGSDKNLHTAAKEHWAAGAIRVYAGLSSGEFYNGDGPSNIDYYSFSTNKLTLYNQSGTIKIWSTAYTTIYGANSIIEGIAASTSGLSADVRKALTGEAKFIRAFTYFYLTNLFGDVPLVLTVNFHETINMARTPQLKVYQQIIDDLKEAQSSLSPDYKTELGERVRANKWAAAALLARVYLYRGDYENAEALATTIINEQGLYKLESDLNKTFQNNSMEAIWQLKPFAGHSAVKNATPEGYITLPNPRYTGKANFVLSNQLMNAFEPGDKRRADWLDSTIEIAGRTDFYPTKYKIGISNGAIGTPREYYMMLRLAEIYLIRAEAIANKPGGNLTLAIDDLNAIRFRAGLEDLPETLQKPQLLAAIEQERQVELFAEWGHRWFDLRRTNRASAVLQTMSLKLPWEGDYQLLYPIPLSEREKNNLLTQNPEYF